MHFLIALSIWILDYIIPAMGTKRFGGSRAGIIGTSIGLIIGLIFLGPFGIIIGPFLGALFGELINKSEFNKAFKAAFGSFLGFIASTFIKFVIAVIYLGLFVFSDKRKCYELSFCMNRRNLSTLTASTCTCASF